MKRGLVVALALLALLSLNGATGRAQAPVNLLQNPGFEGNYFPWGGINEIQVAPGWTPWWRERTESDPPATYFKPEYKKADGYVYPNRVHGGATAQQWFTFYATHQAGMYQQVFNVTPGVRYRFSIWAQVWSSIENDPSVSIGPAYPNLQVGIDPTGDWNPWADTVVWSGTYAFYDHWGQLAVEAVARNNVITVFMRSQPEFPVKHNDTYWDDAELVAVGQGAPPTAPPQTTPRPTATRGTPRPTATCAPPPQGWTVYQVQAGDTLAKLAAHHNTTVEAIIAANCLQTTTIYVNQKLLVPGNPTPTLTSTPPASATPSPTATATQTATPIPPTATATPAPPPTATSAPTAVPFTPTPLPSSGVCGSVGIGLLMIAFCSAPLRLCARLKPKSIDEQWV